MTTPMRPSLSAVASPPRSSPAEPIGIRPLSLFVIAQPESMIAPLPSLSGTASPNAPPMLAVETTDDRALPLLADSAERVAPLIEQWLGPHPLTALTIIDHSGQPFEDGPLLVAPVGPLGGSDSSSMLAHSLTHAWVQTGQPWMDEGLAEFFTLVWVEHERGRDAAIKQLDALMQPVAAADNVVNAAAEASSPDATSSSSTQGAVVGQPLITAYDELFFRRKAAAVWWMLRDIAGEQPLQLALTRVAHAAAESRLARAAGAGLRGAAREDQRQRPRVVLQRLGAARPRSAGAQHRRRRPARASRRRRSRARLACGCHGA